MHGPGGGGGGSLAHKCATHQRPPTSTLLEEEKSATWNPFCPVFRTLGKKGSQKGSLHVQELKKVPYITKNGSKEPKKVLKWL